MKFIPALKQFSALLITGILFTSISTGFTFPQKNINSITSTISADSSIAKQRVISFLRWYKRNINKVGSFQLLTDDAKGFTNVNKKACAAYLNYLKGSNLLSPKYISHWKKYLDDQAIIIKKDKITKGDVPEGFDFDFVLISQDPAYLLDEIDHLHFSTTAVTSTTATIKATLPSDPTIDYEFEMSKTAAGWQIDYISTPNYD